jgi:hypothetical protein
MGSHAGEDREDRDLAEEDRDLAEEDHGLVEGDRGFDEAGEHADDSVPSGPDVRKAKDRVGAAPDAKAPRSLAPRAVPSPSLPYAP